jgi:hypothetical protein
MCQPTYCQNHYNFAFFIYYISLPEASRTFLMEHQSLLIFLSWSDNKMKGSLYCLVNFWWDSTVSLLIPITSAPKSLKSSYWSRKLHACAVHPGVLSLGKINNQRFLTYQHLTVKIIAISVFRFKIWDAVPLIPLLSSVSYKITRSLIKNNFYIKICLNLFSQLIPNYHHYIFCCGIKILKFWDI